MWVRIFELRLMAMALRAVGLLVGLVVAVNIAHAATGDAARSTVVATPSTVPADGSTASTITVTLNDSAGAGVSNKKVYLFQFGGSGTAWLGPGVTNASGIVTFSVTSSAAGSATYRAFDRSDFVLVDQTAAVTFGPSASSSTVAANPASIPADGTSMSTIIVTLKDDAGNGVPGKTVSLTANSGSSSISAASSVSTAAGVVIFSVKDTVAESVTYRATDTTDGIVITQTATVNFASVAPNFNAFETGTAAGAISGSIFTKTAGTGFALAVVAINSGVQADAFTNNVKVELLANTGAPGSSYGPDNCPVANAVIRTIASAPISGGRSTLTFSPVANAYRDVRVRISYPASSPTVTACSTDSFAIRPASLTIAAVTDSTWTAAGTTRTLNNLGFAYGNPPVHKAGRPFNIIATAKNSLGNTITNYGGNPTALATSCLTAGAACATTLGTVSTGTWTNFNGTLMTSTASYSDVGSFGLQLEDATFSAIDAGDGSSALQRNVPLSAKVDIGRFVPDYFDVAVSNTPQFRTFDDTACVRSFTYIGQLFGYVTAPQATITARNAGGGATRNYQGVWWRLNPAGVTQTYTSGPGMPALNTSSILTPAITPLNNDTGSGTISVNGSDRIAYVRNAAVPQAPFSASIALAMSVEDASENSGSIATPTPALFIGSGTGIAFDGVGVSNGSEFRYGRLNVVNAYGSDRLPLPITVNAQYWNGTAFVTNAADNCTSLAGTNFALSAGRGAAINTTIQGSGTMVSGMGKIMLTKPTAVTSKGSVIVGPGPAIISYLPGSGVASFGIPNNGPVIYMREIY